MVHMSRSTVWRLSVRAEAEVVRGSGAVVGTEDFKPAGWYVFLTRCRYNLASDTCNMFGMEVDQCYASRVVV
jgi:hypothetical protein